MNVAFRSFFEEKTGTIDKNLALCTTYLFPPFQLLHILKLNSWNSRGEKMKSLTYVFDLQTTLVCVLLSSMEKKGKCPSKAVDAIFPSICLSYILVNILNISHVVSKLVKASQ